MAVFSTATSLLVSVLESRCIGSEAFADSSNKVHIPDNVEEFQH